MNSFVIIACLVAVTIAKPFDGSVDLTQDTLGNYNLKYETEDASRNEERTQDGTVVGSYTYKDTEGDIHTIKYVTANGGFRAEGASLPVHVRETPEVASARYAHLAIVEKERASLPPLSEAEQYHHSEPSYYVPEVQYTHEPEYNGQDDSAAIAASNAHHFAAHNEALNRLAEAYRVAPPEHQF